MKKAFDSIDDIAARNSLNIESRKKTMLDRMREIKQLKAEMAAADEQVGEKDPDAGDDEDADGDERRKDEEQP